MSGGVKGIRYKVEQLNKDLPRCGIDRSKYGIPYRVVNQRSIFSETPSLTNKKPTSTFKNNRNNFNIFDMSFKDNIIVSGNDSKQFLDNIVTADNKIMEVGQTRKSLILNQSGKIIGLGIINKFQHYYSLIMESKNKNTLIDHLYDNMADLNVTISNNTIEDTFFINGSKSFHIIKKIQEYLQPSSVTGGSTIKDLALQRNAQFTNQFIPNNTFTIINTPMGYYVSINKVIINNLFKNLDLEISDHDIYNTSRIECGVPDYVKDIGELYNPVEANLHSHFSKNYEYSKRRSIGTDFIGKNALFNNQGIFRRFNKTRVMMYSCGKGLIPPEGSSIYLNSKKVGSVTSSTSSRYLKCIVAMGYIDLQKTFDTNSFSLAREMVKKVEINGNKYIIRFL